MHNVIVCGGRVGRNLSRDVVFAALDILAKESFPTPFRIVQGAAKKVDTWAGQWALQRGHKMQPVPIDPRFDGDHSNSPFNRNARMQRDFPASVCVGFPGGGGTLNMMTICHDAGVPVADVEIAFDGTVEIKWWPPK